MNMISKTALSKATPLMLDTQTVKEKNLEYGLWLYTQEESNHFFVSVRLGGEEFVSEVGGDLPLATDLFLRLQRGSVTPCCAADVIEDYWFEKHHS